MNRTKRAYWVLGMGLLALIAVVIYVSVVSNGGDTDTDDGRGTALLDEAGQSPRVQPKQENLQTPRIETAETSEPKSDQNRQHGAETQQNVDADESLSAHKPSILYDVAGGVGEPPEDWREDYSHWDSHYGDDLMEVGIVQREEGFGKIYRPTEAARRRVSELEEEMLKAVEDGLLSREPKGDYIRQEIDEGKVVYVAPNFVERYNALLEEHVAINEQNMHTVPSTSYSGSSSMGTIKFDSGLQITYYRRKSDGSLVRSVDLPSGGTKEYVLADSEPDLSGFSEEEIEMMKESWR
ncbi:MAG: hypothetical protein OXT69_13955 [Candidatus Poribacteria bacterium]|nr:hypothetical protein [Candidatus Poribacteria bacterium]